MLVSSWWRNAHAAIAVADDTDKEKEDSDDDHHWPPQSVNLLWEFVSQ